MNVPAEWINEAMNTWDEFGTFFTRQPGYMSAKLLPSHDIQSKFTLITIAKWESKANVENAILSAELKEIAKGNAEFIRYPAIYQTVRNV